MPSYFSLVEKIILVYFLVVEGGKKQSLTATSRQNHNGINQFSTIVNSMTNGEQEGLVKRSNSFDATNFHKVLDTQPEKPVRTMSRRIVIIMAYFHRSP